MAVHAVPLPGPIARLDTGRQAPCPSDSAALRKTPVIVQLQDGRRLRVALTGAKLALQPIPPCAESQDGKRAGLLSGTRPQRGSGELREVWLAEPTRIYPHDIFARPGNAASVRAVTADGRELRYAAPPGAVIEDRLPRLAHAWGHDVALTVQSSTQDGAAVVVLGVSGDRLRQIAASEPIGTPRRWLNPIGVADFAGNGIQEVAAVITPHMGGWLAIYRRDGDRLSVVDRMPGFSNHAIGTDEVRLAAMLDTNGDGVVDLAVPSADRRTLRVVTFAGGEFRELQRIGHSAAIGSAVIAADLDGDGRQELVYALADGLLVVLTAPH